MAEVDPRQFENESEDPTLQQERDTESNSELDALLASLEDEGGGGEVTREEYDNLRKGMQKLATTIGREKAKSSETPSAPVAKTASEPKTVPSELDEVTALFLEVNPNANLVMDKLEHVAKAMYGGSKIKAWRNEEWLRDLATKQSAEKTEEQAARKKIDRPASGALPKGKDIASVKEEDVESLSPEQKKAWVRLQASKGQDD